MFSKFFTILSILFIVFFKSQSIDFSSKLQIEYEFVYHPDSTDYKFTRKELMILYVDNDKSSLFESYVRRYIDSVGMNYNGQVIDMSKFPKRNVTSTIYKNYGQKNYKFYDDVYGLNFMYDFDSKMDWELLEEKKTIGDYKCNFAKLSYGGRIFYAWYTKDIPIFDGPYKFSGLPGLILTLYDSDGYFNFKVNRILKRNVQLKRNFKHFVKVSKNQYYKKKMDYLQSKFLSNKIVINPIERTLE